VRELKGNLFKSDLIFLLEKNKCFVTIRRLRCLHISACIWKIPIVYLQIAKWYSKLLSQGNCNNRPYH